MSTGYRFNRYRYHLDATSGKKKIPCFDLICTYMCTYFFTWFCMFSSYSFQLPIALLHFKHQCFDPCFPFSVIICKLWFLNNCSSVRHLRIFITAPDYVPLIFFKVAMNWASQQEMQELELDVVNAKPFFSVAIANCRKETGIFYDFFEASLTESSKTRSVHTQILVWRKLLYVLKWPLG